MVQHLTTLLHRTLMCEKGPQYPEKYRTGLDFPDNETPRFRNRILSRRNTTF